MPEIQNTESTAASGLQPQHRPYNPKYRVTSVPLSYDAQVQLAAVLRVIYPRVKSTPKLIIEATARVCQRWRIRADQLAKAGWVPLAGSERKSQLPNALGCPPAFVMTFEKSERAKRRDKKRTGCCHLRQLCPFCWAREVRRYWLKLEPAFFPRPGVKKHKRQRQVDTGPPDESSPSFTHSVKDGEKLSRSPYDLVYRVFTFPVPVYGRQAVADASIIEDGVIKPVPDVFITKPGLPTWLNRRLHGRPSDPLYRLPECRGAAEVGRAGRRRAGVDPVQWARYRRGWSTLVDGPGSPIDPGCRRQRGTEGTSSDGHR